MTVLKGLKELNGGTVILRVLSDGEVRSYFLCGRAYREIGAPTVGEVLDGVLDDILLADESYRAEKKALSLLSYADNNRHTLQMKLMRAGFGRDISREVTEEMVRLGYINEQAQLERLILNEANVKLSGPGKLVPKLCAKGFKMTDVKAELHRLIGSGVINFEDNKQRLISKKASDSSDDEIRALLYKYGYTSI